MIITRYQCLKKIKKNHSKTNFKKINYDKPKSISNNTYWTDISLTTDSNKAIEHLMLKIKKCINESERSNSNKKIKSSPRKCWITKAIITSCEKKEKLYNI